MTTNSLEDWFERMPVVAILRGVRPEEATDIANAVFEAGIGVIEVPLNSPTPYDSIGRLSAALGERCVIGAGTVLTVEQVDAVREAGGRIVVSPNTDTAVIARSVELGLIPLPGWATPSDAFAACGAGARYLKLFPAATFGPGHVKAIRAVLPAEARVLAVGGVAAEDVDPWLDAGVAGFGIGTELYTPGLTASQVADRAARIVAAIRDARDRH